MKTMTKEMDMMTCMSKMEMCCNSMMNCMQSMKTMKMNNSSKMMMDCMDMCNQSMRMMRDMNMMDAGTKMMADCMKMMMKCMCMMMEDCMKMMKSSKTPQMKKMMDDMMMCMKEMEGMMKKDMNMMMCMNMMQKMSMMYMDMEMMMMKKNDASMVMCMDMMKSMCMTCNCMCMMCDCMYMAKGVEMPMMMNMQMAEIGMNEIKMAEIEMPGMMAMREMYCESKPLKGMKIACSMHITIQTAVMMKTMMMMGAEVRCCACNTNSTQEAASAAMNMMGIPTFGVKGMSMDDMAMCMDMCCFMDEDMKMPVNMMMDCSGMMTEMMMEKHPKAMKQMMGCCMDSIKGMQMMNKMMTADKKLMMPIMNMNTSPREAKIDYRYGTMESLTASVRNLTGMMISGKVCVVAGYGDLGKACADAMRMAGARVIVTEIDPFCALQACMDGCMVMKMEDACKMADIIVTATENRDVIMEKHFKMMKNNCVVCNMSDYDCEIDMMWLNKTHGKSKMTMKPMVDMYKINGKSIFVLGEGMAVNMASSTGYSSFIMSACFTIQMMAIMDFYKNNKNYKAMIHRMPYGIGMTAATMHLKQLGVELDTLSSAQEKCMKELETILPGKMISRIELADLM
jgi:adenosylhomocysteinase